MTDLLIELTKGGMVLAIGYVIRQVTEFAAVFCRSDKPSKRLSRIRRSPKSGD
jgi:hypothetical protein